ncbi:hypothetical protein MPH_08803 [Macrophomina phaseolina MS6]|uniref:Uncharacterized protein n=1 Tax=Macrophomina phaseolina (strain MS6) TaxID=1126212 RepID=K2QWD9_MACPH|nr:hypothetical protein MPH_08803 [Macrophomina phaseolina MS6]
MDCNSTVARSVVGVELRSWDPSNIPRTRHMCGDTSWEKLHDVAFSTFERDPALYTVHFHRDSFRDPTTANKPRMIQNLWTSGVYHGVALRVKGDRKFVIYAHFVRKK